MDQKEESKRRIKEIWIYISNSICSIRDNKLYFYY